MKYIPFIITIIIYIMMMWYILSNNKKKINIILYNLLFIIPICSLIILLGKILITGYLIIMIIQITNMIGKYKLNSINGEKIIFMTINYKNQDNTIINFINFILGRQQAIFFDIIYSRKIRQKINIKLILKILFYIITEHGFIFGEVIYIFMLCIKNITKRWDITTNMYTIQKSFIDKRKIYIYKIKEYNGYERIVTKLTKKQLLDLGIEIFKIEKDISSVVMQSITPKNKIMSHRVIYEIDKETGEILIAITLTHNPIGQKASLVYGDKTTNLVPCIVENEKDLINSDKESQLLKKDMNIIGLKYINLLKLLKAIEDDIQKLMFRIDFKKQSTIEEIKINTFNMKKLIKRKEELEEIIKNYELTNDDMRELILNQTFNDLKDFGKNGGK